VGEPCPSKAGEGAVPVSLGQLTSYFTFGFGGPIALTAAMQRDPVLARRLGHTGRIHRWAASLGRVMSGVVCRVRHRVRA